MSEVLGYVPNRLKLFGHGELSRLISPKSIAVVGASETPGSFGLRTLENIQIGYTGKVFPINPRYEKIQGLTSYPSLESLPEVPDCVIVIVPMAQVESLVEIAAKMGVGGMIIYSAGFAEVGDVESAKVQQRIAKIADQSGMRILGPNCIGIVNFNDRVGLTFMPKFNEMPIHKGSIGLISQSGALGYCVLQGAERGIGFTHYLAPGNSCDVDVCDFINYLVEDEGTKVIICMFEGVRDGSRLVKAAENALKAGKPLLIYKLANAEIGQRSAMSHTGTMAGSYEAYEAVFKKTGVVIVDNWEEALEAASLFEKSMVPTTHGVGIMASSGGAAIMGADKAEEYGLYLPPPEEKTSKKLAEVVPNFGSTANPCDLTAESLKSVEMYGECIKAFADDVNFAAVIVPMMSAHKPATVDRAKYLAELASTLKKPICLVWINEWLQGPGSEIYDAAPGISMFRSMGRCIKFLKKWIDYHNNRPVLLKQLSETTKLIAKEEEKAQVAGLLKEYESKKVLSENQAKGVLKAFGISVTEEFLAKNSSEIMASAEKLGFPVVLKVDSNDIPHKTEYGLVKLNIETENELEQHVDAMTKSISSISPAPLINGYLVQKMIRGGVEMMIGIKQDSQFGPLILCGFGGIHIELTKDVAIANAPVSKEKALEMIQSLKLFPLLNGYRGATPCDVDYFASMVSKVSILAKTFQDRIEEIDINPFILTESGGVAADGLIVIKNIEK